jgi:serine/threonine-protein kinase
MGEVYRAEHAFLRRPTAVKLLSHTDSVDAAAARFEKEVQLTASLMHPNTVRIFDYGRTPDGVFYYAMELVDGGDLDALVQASGPQPPARVAFIMAQVAGSLSEAHEVGLIHRDIKPANILVSSRGVYDLVKVADFGLVREVTEADPTLSAAEIVGTPQFMAPETFTAPEEVDGRADLYALGAVGYYLLTAEHVFVGTGTLQILAAHATVDPDPPSTRIDGIPPELEAIVLRLLAKAPDDRFESAAALADALEPLAARWTRDDAAGWWRDHGEVVRSRESLPFALTLARGSRG